MVLSAHLRRLHAEAGERAGQGSGQYVAAAGEREEAESGLLSMDGALRRAGWSAGARERGKLLYYSGVCDGKYNKNPTYV